MTGNALPATPTGSRFGWPRPARAEEFKKLLATAGGATERVVFQGKTIDIRIICIPIDLPKYRMANGRTSSLQAEHLAKFPKLRKDIFAGDSELWDAQEAQHALLLQLAKRSDLQKYFEDPANRQVNPLLLDENGFVVNGNRRLASWRELVHEDSTRYGHFRHVDAAVLPHCDEKEIDRLEATLQVQKDIKADYSWDALANMMLAKQRRDGFSDKELAELYGMKESEVHELLDMRAYAEDYLRSRQKANFWSQVSESEFAFRKIVVSRSKINGIGKQEVFKEAAFTLIDKPEDAGGRLYEAIPAILESLDLVTAKLLEDFDVKPEVAGAGVEDLFGGTLASPGADPLDMPLARAIQKPENSDRARKIIIEVIESQKQLKRDAKSAGYLLKCCADAQAALAAAVKDGLRSESKTTGVSKQLAQIDEQVAVIRKFIETHAER